MRQMCTYMSHDCVYTTEREPSEKQIMRGQFNFLKTTKQADKLHMSGLSSVAFAILSSFVSLAELFYTYHEVVTGEDGGRGQLQWQSHYSVCHHDNNCTVVSSLSFDVPFSQEICEVKGEGRGEEGGGGRKANSLDNAGRKCKSLPVESSTLKSDIFTSKVYLLGVSYSLRIDALPIYDIKVSSLENQGC